MKRKHVGVRTLVALLVWAILFGAQGFTDQQMVSLATLDLGAGFIAQAITVSEDIPTKGRIFCADNFPFGNPPVEFPGFGELHFDPTTNFFTLGNYCRSAVLYGNSESGGDIKVHQSTLYATNHAPRVGKVPCELRQQPYSLGDPDEYKCEGRAAITCSSSPFLNSHEIAFGNNNRMYIANHEDLIREFPLDLSSCDTDNHGPINDFYNAYGIYIPPDGNKAYVANYNGTFGGVNYGGLYIFNNLDPPDGLQSNYNHVAFEYARDVVVKGQFAYVTADSPDRLKIIKIIDTTYPEASTTYLIDIDQPYNIELKDCVAFIGDQLTDGIDFAAYDISDPYNVGSPLAGFDTATTTGGDVRDFALAGDYAFLAKGGPGYEVLGISAVHAEVQLISPPNFDPGTPVYQDCTVTLDWMDKPDGSVSGEDDLLDHYKLYFGTTNPPPLIESYLTASQYAVSGLMRDKSYFWKVEAVMRHCGEAESEVWTFKTMAPTLNLTLPLNGAAEINPANPLTLDWEDFPDATAYDLYFGRSYPPPFHATIAGSISQYDITALQSNAIYFWRVVAKKSCDALSPTWSFATENLSGSLLVFPGIGTTAGGTDMFVYGPQNAFPDAALAVGFDLGNTCPEDHNATSTTVWLDSADLIWVNDHYMRIKTPRITEGMKSVVIENEPPQPPPDPPPPPTTFDHCKTNAFDFRTLAYTANQVTQDLSVVDTTQNGPFATPSIAFGQPIVPMGMDYLRGAHPGRELLMVDVREGQVYVHDAANFSEGRKLTVQHELTLPWFFGNVGAVDVTAGADGTYAYVIHMTHGGPKKYHAAPVNYYGSVSVLKFKDDGRPPACPGGVYPCVLDIDGSTATTTWGAPTGISRIEPSHEWWYMPLAGEDVYVPKASESDYVVGDRYPGEYLFLSGFGPAEWGWVRDPDCQPGERCPPIRIILPRPVQVAIVDLNPFIVESVTLEKGYTVLNKIANPYYRTFVSKRDFGSQGGYQTDHGLDFSPVSTFGEIRLYAVNSNQDMAVELAFHPDRLPNPIVIPQPGPHIEGLGAFITGPHPTDVKVQKVLEDTYAYITNAGDDTLTVVDTALNEELPDDSPVSMDLCYNNDNYPTSFDTRSVGDFGYSSNFTSNTVSVINLPGSICSVPLNSDGAIHVGEAPIRIVVQPVPTDAEIFGVVRNSLAFAQPSDFTTPSKQSNLIRDWENVHQLEQTNANPQAVVSNINAFQGNVDKWVTNAALKKSVNEGVNLYRAAYIHDHPTPRQ